jgi:hypothetical protein
VFPLLRNWLKRPPKVPRQTVQEFLYLDIGRLSAYVDQLRAPVTYDKVPNWTAELGTTGPVAKGQQTRTQRPFTAAEQLLHLERSLLNSKELAPGRWDGTQRKGETPAFRKETCLARRVLVGDEASGHQQALWVSRYNPIAWTDVPKTLVLFEGNRVGDGQPKFLSEVSDFFYYFQDAEPAIWTPETLGKALDNRSTSLEEAFQKVSNRLALNPFGLLEELGARIFPERCISTVYRVRTALRTSAPKMIPAMVTLGYS